MALRWALSTDKQKKNQRPNMKGSDCGGCYVAHEATRTERERVLNLFVAPWYKVKTKMCKYILDTLALCKQ